MSYKYTTFFKWISISIDYLFLNLSLSIGLLLTSPSYLDSGIPDQYKLNFLLFNLIWFYCSHLVELYQDVLSREAIPTIKATILALAMYFSGLLALKLTLRQLALTFEFVWLSSFLFGFVLLTVKVAFLFIRKTKRHLLMNYKKVVIIGAGQTGEKIRDYINRTPHLGYKIEGFFDDRPSSAQNLDILGSIDQCFPRAKAMGVSEIFYTLPTPDKERVDALIHEADKNMIRFRLVPEINLFLEKNVFIDFNGPAPILSHRQEPLEDRANRFVKRVFDLVVSSLVIIFILSWLIPVMALIIKLESKGPVFFRQLRSGRYNKPFYCFKFRSMHLNDESDKKQASKGDARVTRVGAFIRKTNIDELPQFLNVLLGDMSVIGPRPHMLKHTEDYSAVIDEYMVRHYLTPGISGWAQVNGFRGETKDMQSMQKRIMADIWYLENWSLLLDLKIVFLTIWLTIRGDRDAY
ncbi:undecaprenyl-phosphate glucose phosphotransferase [Rufibacter aurantiacus]|uniref:undecaprenyl-phosphate glucose phosphotransferase n=1 Tax=Rufibacter aurantiacus TaxID=2817374 RepID=UPI001B3027DD|nr:undecaprenyl-phosphate glucose phosphotransferase [Rufibacter aurantiacus]